MRAAAEFLFGLGVAEEMHVHRWRKSRPTTVTHIDLISVLGPLRVLVTLPGGLRKSGSIIYEQETLPVDWRPIDSISYVPQVEYGREYHWLNEAQAMAACPNHRSNLEIPRRLSRRLCCVNLNA